MAYRVIKTYPHELGLSVTYRQWRAMSHCKHLHGYSLAFTFVFEADELDENNWTIDFGGLKGIRNRLEANFDHKLCLAADDPELKLFHQLAERNCADTMVFPAVGCEAFAKIGYDIAKSEVFNMQLDHRVRVISCECREHGANAATYQS